MAETDVFSRASTSLSVDEIEILENAEDLIANLKAKDPKERMISISELQYLSELMGAKRTRNNLIPFLVDMDEDDEDCLLELNLQLRSFLAYIGGVDEVTCLFPLLVNISNSLGIHVMNEVNETLKILINDAPSDIIQGDCLSLCESLAREKREKMRLTACHFLIAVLDRAVKMKLKATAEQLIMLYYSLCYDASRSVNRMAGTNFGDFLKALSSDTELLIEEKSRAFAVVDFFESSNASNTYYEAVRIAAVFMLKSLLEFYPDYWFERGYASFEGFSADSSWRVRCTVVSALAEVAPLVNLRVFRTKLGPIYFKLISDEDFNVVSAAIKILPDIIQYSATPDADIQSISQKISKAAYADGPVASALKFSVAEYFRKLPISTSKETISNYIIPLFLQLTGDERDVLCCELLLAVDRLTKICGPKMILNLIDKKLLELATNKSWRVRVGVCEILPLFFMDVMQNAKTATSLFSMISYGMLDNVWSIRSSAWKCYLQFLTIARASSHWTAHWETNFVTEYIGSLMESGRYAIKIDVLRHTSPIISVLGDQFFYVWIYPWMMRMARYSVSNVRLNVAKAFHVLQREHPSVHTQLVVTITSLLKQLSDDDDTDVRYYADAARSAKPVQLIEYQL